MQSQAGSYPSTATVDVILPAVPLRGYVTFYYFVEVPGLLRDFLYPEWGNVRFALDGTWRVHNDPRDEGVDGECLLFGPTDRCGQIETSGGRIAGFGLTPLGWNRLISQSASEMANRMRELDDDLGMDPVALQAALIADGRDHSLSASRFDRVISAMLNARPSSSRDIIALDQAIRKRCPDVDSLAAEVGVSNRTLHRLCLRAFGFPPKRLLRRQRFLETLGVIRISRGAEVGSVIGEDYYDHSHFNRDFRDFMGMTARDYARTPRDLMKAAAAAQVASGVPLSFELPDAT